MNNYLNAVLGILMFLALIDTLVQKTSNGRVVKVVISLISVSVLLNPIISILKGSFDFNLDFSSETYLEYALDIEKSVIENVVKTTLKDSEFDVDSVDSEFLCENNKFTLKTIKIILKNQVINCENERINTIENIKTLLKTKIDFEKVELIVE